MQQHDLRPNQGRIPGSGASAAATPPGRARPCRKGTKGQKPGPGSPRRGFEGGQIPIQKRMPHKRGFRNPFRAEFEIINLERIEELIEEQRIEGVIDSQSLARAGAIDNDLTRPLKILGNGELSQAIHVKAHKVSASARAKIEAAGGTVEVIGGETAAPEGE
ncbi:MAG: 50S ribosomal protein L15 [Thermomicrobiales bacterium]